jgi:hypothetical protein
MYLDSEQNVSDIMLLLLAEMKKCHCEYRYHDKALVLPSQLRQKNLINHNGKGITTYLDMEC